MSKQDHFKDIDIVYSWTKFFISIPKKATVRLYKNSKLVLSDNKAYSFRELSVIQILKKLWLYIVFIILFSYLLIYFISTTRAKIDALDIIIVILMYIGGIFFYFGYVLNNRQGHIFYLIFLSILFICLGLTALLGTYKFLMFLSLFDGICFGGMIFWILYNKTYFLLRKNENHINDELIFKIL